MSDHCRHCDGEIPEGEEFCSEYCEYQWCRETKGDDDYDREVDEGDRP